MHRIGYVIARQKGRTLVHFCASDDATSVDHLGVPDPELEDPPCWIVGNCHITWAFDQTQPPKPSIALNPQTGELAVIPPAPRAGLARIEWDQFARLVPSPREPYLQEPDKPFRPSRKTLEKNKEAREKKVKGQKKSSKKKWKKPVIKFFNSKGQGELF